MTFLGLLELIKAGAIRATQGEHHGEIRVELLRDVDAAAILEVDFEEEGVVA